MPMARQRQSARRRAGLPGAVWSLADSAVDSNRAVSDTARMIRTSAALYYWFGFPTISAEGGMRVI
jgi:hypothetical protein